MKRPVELLGAKRYVVRYRHEGSRRTISDVTLANRPPVVP